MISLGKSLHTYLLMPVKLWLYFMVELLMTVGVKTELLWPLQAQYLLQVVRIVYRVTIHVKKSAKLQVRVVVFVLHRAVQTQVNVVNVLARSAAKVAYRVLIHVKKLAKLLVLVVVIVLHQEVQIQINVVRVQV